MSKKSSPQARSSRRPRSRGRVESGVRGVSRVAREQAPGARDDADRVSLKARLKYFVPFTVLPNVIVVSVLLVLAIAGLMLTNTTLVAIPATVAQLWLIFNAAPVAGGGQVVTAVPLLPALILVVVLAGRVYKAIKDRVSLADLNVVVSLVLLVPLLLTLISWGMLIDAASVLPVEAPPLWVALGRTLLVHTLVLVIGLGSRLWRALCRRFGFPEWMVDASNTALKFLGIVAVCGLLLSLIMLIAHAKPLGELLSQFHGAGAVAGLVLLCVVYVPNVALASASVLLGGEYHFGEAWVSLFGSHVVPFPTLPWLVVIPPTVYPFAWLLLIIPIGVAVAVVRKRLETTEQPFAEMLISGLFAGAYTFIACFFVSGRMGIYSATGPMLWLTTILSVAWLAGVGLLVAGVQNMRSRRAIVLPPEEDYPNDQHADAEEPQLRHPEEPDPDEFEEFETPEEAEEVVTEPAAEPAERPSDELEEDSEFATQEINLEGLEDYIAEQALRDAPEDIPERLPEDNDTRRDN